MGGDDFSVGGFGSFSYRPPASADTSDAGFETNSDSDFLTNSGADFTNFTPTTFGADCFLDKEAGPSSNVTLGDSEAWLNYAFGEPSLGSSDTISGLNVPVMDWSNSTTAIEGVFAPNCSILPATFLTPGAGIENDDLSLLYQGGASAVSDFQVSDPQLDLAALADALETTAPDITPQAPRSAEAPVAAVKVDTNGTNPRDPHALTIEVISQFLFLKHRTTMTVAPDAEGKMVFSQYGNNDELQTNKVVGDAHGSFKMAMDVDVPGKKLKIEIEQTKDMNSVRVLDPRSGQVIQEASNPR